MVSLFVVKADLLSLVIHSCLFPQWLFVQFLYTLFWRELQIQHNTTQSTRIEWSECCCLAQCVPSPHQENDIFLGWEKGAGKKWGKSKRKGGTDLSLEEIKKQAAVQCLRSASDEVSPPAIYWFRYGFNIHWFSRHHMAAPIGYCKEKKMSNTFFSKLTYLMVNFASIVGHCIM